MYEDTKTFGVLQNFSAFPFENYLQSFGRFIRKGDKPLSQVVRRIIEQDHINSCNSEFKTDREKNYMCQNTLIMKDHYWTMISVNSKLTFIVLFKNFEINPFAPSLNTIEKYNLWHQKPI